MVLPDMAGTFISFAVSNSSFASAESVLDSYLISLPQAT